MGRHDVDLLPGVLPDVGDVQHAALGVEREPPRVAKPVLPDLRTRAGTMHERIVARDGVGMAVIHVDPQDLGQKRAQILAVFACDGGEAGLNF